ncbi:YcsE-related riboflavin metabolism phosphatase [Mycoplasmopsis pulmonis]|nr:Cof-type HAD-IIB family hydrolase [Mycoplasmopsis pulmonis]MDZ7293647.1 Cof-type HAD-IIB family hydrolase [Mycoplasmopsis pulmonis]VEU68314.1 putative phosphotransferase [Mycoplasmopsis pulmonis]
MNKKIKLIISDIDGTILPYGWKRVSDKTVESFQKLKENNYYTALATGREYVTIGDVLDQVGHSDFFIGANGSFIYDIKNKKEIYSNYLNFDNVKKFSKFFKANFNNDLMFVTDDKWIHLSDINHSHLDQSWFLANHKDKFKDIADKSINKEKISILTIVSKDENVYNECKGFIEKNCPEIEINTKWSSGFFVSSKGTNKLSAAKALSTHLNSSIDQVMAFGDSENDIEMIKGVGHGIAVANALDSVKKVAKLVVGPANKDGVFHYLKEQKFI